jgi:hypothetical protein
LSIRARNKVLITIEIAKNRNYGWFLQGEGILDLLSFANVIILSHRYDGILSIRARNKVLITIEIAKNY